MTKLAHDATEAVAKLAEGAAPRVKREPAAAGAETKASEGSAEQRSVLAAIRMTEAVRKELYPREDSFICSAERAADVVEAGKRLAKHGDFPMPNNVQEVSRLAN